MPKKSLMMTAIVLLRPASGRRIGGTAQNRAANLPQYLPAQESAERARIYIRRQGFEVSELAGISFNIAGNEKLFADEFGIAIDLSEGYPRVKSAQGTFGFELPLVRLPPSLRDAVEQVTFDEPAELYGGTFQ